MKTVLAYVLYFLGDVISKMMNTNFTYWLYPVYNKLMIWSMALDTKGHLWKTPDEHENYSDRM